MPQSLPPDDNKAAVFLGPIWASNLVDFIVVGLRLYDRIYLKGGLGWDDYSIVAALAVTTFGSCCNAVMASFGFGRHWVYLTPEQQSGALEWVTFAELQSYFAVYLVKLSVCLFVLRLLSGTNMKARWIVYALIALLTIVTIITVIFLLVSCIPLQGVWILDPNFPKKCLSPDVQTSVTKAFGVIGILTDFSCVALPLAVIRRLQMNKRSKIAICLILALGLVTSACAIGKTVTAIFTSDDITQDFIPVLVWAGFEANLGIIVASLPALRQLFGEWLRLSTSRGIRTSGYTLQERNTRRSKIGKPKHEEVTRAESDRQRLMAASNGVLRTTSFTVESERRGGAVA